MRQTSVEEQFRMSVSRLNYGFVLASAAVIALLSSVVAFSSHQTGVPKRPYLLALLFGWIPGLALTVGFMGGFYMLIFASWFSLVVSIGLLFHQQWWLRVVELLVCTALSMVWFLLA